MKPLLIISAVLLALGLVTIGAVFAYDGSRGEKIAAGITVGGIDVGGLEPAAARARVEEEMVAPLEKPVVVDYDERTWKLGAREARVRTNTAQVIEAAVARSEEGGVFGRTFRRLTGGRIDADLKPAVTFSDGAVVRLIDRVRKGVERPATDAKMHISTAGVEAESGRSGRKLESSRLHKAIDGALVSPAAERRFVAATHRVAPKVTRAELVKKNPVVLIADRSAFELRVYKKLNLAKTYKIAVGQAGYDTPAGEYTIANKAVNPVWNVPNSDWAGALAGTVIPGGAPNNPLKARWLGIAAGVGIHGTSDRGSVGSNASHGCLRMLVEDVVELYPQVPVGSKVLIV